MRPLITPQNLRHRFWKRILFASLAGLLCVLLLLPTLLSQLIRYQVPRMGLGTVEIGNLDLNLFRGKLLLEEVGLYKSAARLFYLQRGELDLSILALLEQRLLIQSLSLQGLSLTLQQEAGEPLQIAGVALPATPASEEEGAIRGAEGSNWAFGIDTLEISDSSLLVLHPQFAETVQLDHLSLGPLAMWRPESVTPISLGVTLREGTIRLSAKSNPLAVAPRHQIELTIASLPLASLAQLTEPTLGGLAGMLSSRMTLQVQQHADRHLTLTQQGSLSLSGLQLQSGDHALVQEGLQWDGRMTLADAANLDTLQINGGLKLTDVEMKAKGMQNPVVSLRSLTLSGVELVGRRELALSEVMVDSMVTAAVRRRDGVALAGLPAAPAPKEQAAVSEPSTAALESEPFQLRIDRVRLSGTNRFSFADETVKPPFRHSITINEGELQHIDTRQPMQVTTVMLQGKDDYYTTFSLDGKSKPFAPQLAIDVKARLHNFDMPPTSPYLAQLLGYRITTGQLDSEVAMQIENNMMKGEVDLRMNQLQLDPEDPARIAEFQSKTTLPLNTALSLLRDSDDNIQLKLPISGKLDDPQFNLNDIINTALGKSLKMASVSYLKLLLQPYGSLISVIQMAGQAAGHIVLDPLAFSPGSAELSAGALPYLERLSKLLEKKSINMQLCGFATPSDLMTISKGKEQTIPPAGHPLLEALAKQRAESIKLILVQNHGVPPQQLFVCHPQLDHSAGAAPRVELSL